MNEKKLAQKMISHKIYGRDQKKMACIAECRHIIPVVGRG